MQAPLWRRKPRGKTFAWYVRGPWIDAMPCGWITAYEGSLRKELCKSQSRCSLLQSDKIPLFHNALVLSDIESLVETNFQVVHCPWMVGNEKSMLESCRSFTGIELEMYRAQLLKKEWPTRRSCCALLKYSGCSHKNQSMEALGCHLCISFRLSRFVISLN